MSLQTAHVKREPKQRVSLETQCRNMVFHERKTCNGVVACKHVVTDRTRQKRSSKVRLHQRGAQVKSLTRNTMPQYGTGMERHLRADVIAVMIRVLAQEAKRSVSAKLNKIR